MGTDISHNVQIAVDNEHHLVVAVDVSSSPADQGQLFNIASKGKEELDVEEITVLADKGYYSGEDLKKCEESNMNAIVARQKMPSHNGNEEYAKDKFQYNPQENIYICPKWHKLYCASKEGSKTKYYRNYEACKNCSAKDKCTKSERGRKITRGKFEEVFERADKRYAENQDLYRLRQMIVEHVFRTVKRSLGFSYFLLRGHENVKAESHLHFLVYNLKRVINIIGAKKLTAYFKALLDIIPFAKFRKYYSFKT